MKPGIRLSRRRLAVSALRLRIQVHSERGTILPKKATLMNFRKV